jgi:hypothetical protein
MKKGILFLLILASLKGVTQPYYLWNDKVQKTYESINSLRIPEARKVIEKELNNHTNNLFYSLLESEADLYQLFFNENATEYAVFYPRFQKRIDLIKSGPKATPYYLYSLGLMHFHKAILAIKLDKNIEAVFDFRKAYIYFKDNKELYPKFNPNDVYFGLLTTIIGAVPTNYQWMLNIFGFNGSITKGNELVLATINSKDEYSKMAMNQALLLYPYLVMNFEGNTKKAFDFIEHTNYDFKRNHIHAYMATNLYLNHQQPLKALEIATNIEQGEAYLSMPFWNYEIGHIYFNEMKLDNAEKEFTQFINTFKGNFYVKDTYDKLSLIAYLKNDIKKSYEYREEVLKHGSLITEADKLAYQNAKSNAWPNLLLLKSRILSDGGFQLQALKVLADKTTLDFKTEDDKTEFSYRLARINDLMGDKEQAIKFYKSTIAKGKNSKQYFAARSALQIALIYEERKDFTNAISFYKNCMEMKNTAFKNSLDQKAKSGILRCQK